jgi:hypothetical protein
VEHGTTPKNTLRPGLWKTKKETLSKKAHKFTRRQSSVIQSETRSKIHQARVSTSSSSSWPSSPLSSVNIFRNDDLYCL